MARNLYRGRGKHCGLCYNRSTQRKGPVLGPLNVALTASSLPRFSRVCVPPCRQCTLQYVSAEKLNIILSRKVEETFFGVVSLSSLAFNLQWKPVCFPAGFTWVTGVEN